MMGERTVMQKALFYGISLEHHVPADHMLRSVEDIFRPDGSEYTLLDKQGPPAISEATVKDSAHKLKRCPS